MIAKDVHVERAIAAGCPDTGGLSTKPMALRTWMSGHNGESVHTAQIQDDGRGSWIPGPRTVSVHSTYMRMDNSRRDFAGVVHVAHKHNLWIGYDTGMRTTLVYWTK